MDSETIHIGRDRLQRVFRYLEALNEHLNPVKRHIGEQLWTLWLKDLPCHPSIRRGGPPTAELPALGVSDGGPVERPDSDFILKIARARLTNPPTPPSLIESWVDTGWEDPFKEVSTLESRSETSPGAARARFESDPKRLAALDQWRMRRDQWAKYAVRMNSARDGLPFVTGAGFDLSILTRSRKS